MRIGWARPGLFLLVTVASATHGACGDDLRAELEIRVPARDLAIYREFVEFTDYPHARVVVDTGAPPDAAVFTIRVADDLDAAAPEAYRIDALTTNDTAWVVHGADRLGAQYGLAHALENLGFRWPHPLVAAPPATPAFDEAARASLGVVHAPAQAERGVQLHTLHPIEAYLALWEPGPASEREARRILDWLVKNRGNYVQWPALDDIMAPGPHAAWRDHTRAVLDAGHARGVRLGLGIQLYGGANLQHAFDLYDDDTGETPLRASLDERLPLITDGLPFDAYSLAFGEFFGSDPDRFIADINTWAEAMAEHAPTARLRGTVHVGEDARVEYQGESLLYYMLLGEADPRVVNDVHTVMFYGLYEDAGGAYRHDSFEEHRRYLLDQMRAGRVGSYFPETAYWVAFDNSVPLAMPLYVRNRWLDLDRLAADTTAEGLAPLHSHILFSSGWEWGYWLHDVTALRASFALPPSYRAAMHEAAAPLLGDDGLALLAELADAQAEALADQRLVAYVAGRDLSMDAGRQVGIISQPDRPPLTDYADAETRATFVRDVLTPLERHAATLDALATRAAELSGDGRWRAELRDGVLVTAARVRFVVARYHAAVAHLDGDDATAATARAAMVAALADGGAIVARRHAALHHPRGAWLTTRAPNQTFYQYGYLTHADELCFWHREQVELDNVLDGASAPLPHCLL
jgi:hypothetical protein